MTEGWPRTALCWPPPSAVTPVLSDLLALRALARGSRCSLPWSLQAPAGAEGLGVPRAIPGERALAYAGSRPYQQGDDVRAIDWRQTARRGRVFTKQYHRERDQSLLLFVALDADMQFGTGHVFKSVAAARAAAMMAWTAVYDGDRVGGVVWGEGLCFGTPPSTTDASLLSFLKNLTTPNDSRHGAAPVDLEEALLRLDRMQPPGGRAVVFAAHRRLACCSRAEQNLLIRIGRHGNLLLVPVFDPLESVPPPPGRYPLMEGGALRILDYRNPDLREKHQQDFQRRTDGIVTLSRSARASMTLWSTSARPELAAVLLEAWGRGEPVPRALK